MLALWSIAQLEDADLPRARDALRAIAAIAPPESQLVDMDREGVDEAFLYPSFGLFVLATDDIDPVLAAALARAYNSWLAANRRRSSSVASRNSSSRSS